MLATKISITLPTHLNQFASDYQHEHHLKSKSEVIAQSLKILEQMHLEAQYRQMGKDFAKNPTLRAELAAWEHTAGEGLDDESW